MVPAVWKTAVITALFKKGSKKLASNYRPVSLTSIVCKLMEKLIRKRIVEHMDKNNLFSDKQFGFLGGRSITLQLLKLIDQSLQWTKIMDEGGMIHAVYMDFMKAFDKVPHKRLLEKLKAYGLSNNICKWVAHFLAGRKQCVQVNGEKIKMAQSH